MLFRRTRKTRYLAEGYIAAVAHTLTPILDARVVYGDGSDRYDTVFVMESHDRKWQLIGTYDEIISVTSAIDEMLYTWVYNNDRTSWFGYEKPNRQERESGHGEE